MKKIYLMIGATCSIAAVSIGAFFVSAQVATQQPAAAPAPATSAPATGSSATTESSTGADIFDSPPTYNKGPGQQPLTKDEVKMFIEEVRNQGREATQLLKDMKGSTAPAELQQTLQKVVSEARSCIEKVQSGGLTEETRQIMNDCRAQNFWNDVNDARQDFVPPQEVKNIIREMSQKERELKSVRQQMAKLGVGTSTADDISAKITRMRKAVESASGQDQRDAMQEYYDARVWEEINDLRTSVEIPRELKRMEKDMARMAKVATAKQNSKAFEFFGIQPATIASLAEKKQESITNIKRLVSAGEFEDARDEMNDTVYQGWHPGDFIHAIEMLRDIHRMLRNIKAKEVQEQVKEVIVPLVEDITNGDVRRARNTLVVVQQQMQRIEFRYRRDSYGDGMELDDRSQKALNKLEQLIEDRESLSEQKNPQPQQDGDKTF